MKLIVTGCAIIIGGIFLYSCEGGDKEASTKPSKVVVKNDSTDLTDPADVETNKVDHRLPTPSLFFEVISGIGGEADLELINPVSKKDDYDTDSKKALNFGVYFADLGYMFNYDSNGAMAEYFAALEELANDLSISAIFSEEIMEKVNSFSDNADSLYAYQNDIYFNAYNYLEEEGKEDLLSYMLIGGWIESMRIVTGLVEDFSKDVQLIEEIAGQREILESILAHVEENIALDDNLGEWYNNLSAINEIYNTNIESSEQRSEKNENGRLMLSGGDKVVIDEKTFGMIVEKVEALRESIVSN